MVITLSDSEREAAWRKEVRDFIQREAPAALKSGGDEGGENSLFGRMGAIKEWREKVAAKGWIAPSWPKRFGGADMTVAEQFIMNEEFAESGVPGNLGGFGVMMIGPTIIEHGTEEQKEEHLTKILKGESIWCQGYSEPGAGADLASLQTRAVRDGDDYVINGQKIWTTGAQYADMMYMLARTDPDAPKHRGISFLLIDDIKNQQGLQLRPLINMANRHHFNEVFFEDVRVPAQNLIGEENRGWYIATTTLDQERSSINRVVMTRSTLAALIDYVRGVPALKARAEIRHELAERHLEFEIGRWLCYRVAQMQSEGKVPNSEASVSKIFGTELQRQMGITGLRVIGLPGTIEPGSKYAPLRGQVERWAMAAPSYTIAGGTSEVNRNIVATRGLGLPRD